MANKAKDKLDKKKEPVAPKFNAVIAAPSAIIRAAARTQNEAQKALASAVVARNIGVAPLPTPLLHLDDEALAGLQHGREDVAKAQCAVGALKARATLACLELRDATQRDSSRGDAGGGCSATTRTTGDCCGGGSAAITSCRTASTIAVTDQSGVVTDHHAATILIF